MGHPRDIAWRRQQRAVHINRRKDRAPDPKPEKYGSRWQLHTPDGDPLPIFHREANKSTEAVLEPQTVTMRVTYHLWQCDRIPDCGCTRSLSPKWAGGMEGFVWMPLYKYTVAEQPFCLSKFDKLYCPKGRSQERTQQFTKNWKLMYFRRNKVYRAARLGWLNYPRNFLDDYPDPGTD